MLLIYLIYSVYNVNKVNYVSISDGVLNKINNYLSEYLYRNNQLNSFTDFFTSSRVIKAYQDLKNNRTIRVNNTDYYIKKVLRESDILVISIGMEEITEYFDKYDMNSNDEFFRHMYTNISRLIKEIKKYVYGKIIFIGYYNPTNYYDANVDRFFYDMNIKLERLMLDNDIIYIDLYEQVKNNNYKEKNSSSLNNEGNRKIASIIEYYLK